MGRSGCATGHPVVSAWRIAQDNQRASRKAKTASDGWYRQGLTPRGAVLAIASSFMAGSGVFVDVGGLGAPLAGVRRLPGHGGPPPLTGEDVWEHW